ncbi:hypothetical protein UB37_19830 [Photobacterium iliopiscarium]|uniref:Secreted protein n=1 Tax=Photobacterium iliopiscarium TaxID=56192 RepID=A0ABX5GML7_9GAMM|nr:hypothetical protein UB37_19830 [Photobacterium iliopiscarium]PSW92193.1 hypothetical protein C9J52_19085 [Photobacterium iliopiscarium]
MFFVQYCHLYHTIFIPSVARGWCDDEFRVVCIITKRNPFDDENHHAMTAAAVEQKRQKKPHTMKKSMKL